MLLVPASSAFGLAGTIFKEQVSPGQELSHKITVSNEKNASLVNLTAEIYGFARNIKGIDIEVPIENDTGTFTARPFLSIEPESFSLGPGEARTLFLNGTVPEDIGSGGKYALVAIKTVPKASKGVSITTAIHAYVLLTIKDGDLIQTGNITALETSKDDNGAKVNLIFENTGNVHYKPLVEAVLKDGAGKILAQGEIKKGPPSYVLPKSSYLFEMTLLPEGGLSSGKYIVEGKVTMEDGTVLDSKETAFEI